MEILFWTLLFLVFYCYLGYPILIYCLSVLFRNKRKVLKSFITPSVSIIISAYNEEKHIYDKIINLLSVLELYPDLKAEIIIGSDGSTDQTNNIVAEVVSPSLSFYPFSKRRGKMATLNDLVAKAQNEILVFSDVRQSFDHHAISELLANFNDSSVGCVSGELCFKPLAEVGGTAKGINLYWRYEKFLRYCESQFYSMLGATGAIYAIRRQLFTPIPEDVVLDDMYIPLKIIEKGFRAIFDPDAKAYDIAADNPKEEYRRKVRTLYGNYQIFSLFGQLFNPFQSPIAFQLFSHKLLRVTVPFLLIILFAINIYLVKLYFIYLILFMGQVIFYILATVGMITKNSQHKFMRIVSKVCYIPFVFCLLNFSALAGFVRFVKGGQTVVWEKAKLV